MESHQELLPKVGEIRRGRDIGKGSNLYIWRSCEGCRTESWAVAVNGKLQSTRCRKCAANDPQKIQAVVEAGYKRQGQNSGNWKGGRIIRRGYALIRIYPNDFFFPMANCGYVFEHRLVVAKALGRCLHLWEIVHHKKGFAKDDNRYPETLQLVTDDRHKQITLLENRIGFLEKRITILEAENILLKINGARDATRDAR